MVGVEPSEGLVQEIGQGLEVPRTRRTTPLLPPRYRRGPNAKVSREQALRNAELEAPEADVRADHALHPLDGCQLGEPLEHEQQHVLRTLLAVTRCARSDHVVEVVASALRARFDVVEMLDACAAVGAW